MLLYLVGLRDLDLQSLMVCAGRERGREEEGECESILMERIKQPTAGRGQRERITRVYHRSVSRESIKGEY